MLWRILFVFFAAFVTDGVWTYYIHHTSKGHPWRASISSSVLVLLSGFLTVEYVSDRRLLFVAALGGFLGAFLLMRRREKDP